MSGFRVLDLVKPFSPFLPEVIAPERKIQFQQKVMWTIITLLIFLVMSEIPLYGIVSSDSSDPLFWLRMMLASNRGTLMELGISPIVSSGMLFQLLQGTKLISVDMSNKTDRENFQVGQKLLAILLAVGQATVYVLTGMYGPPKSLGVGVCLLLILQLVFASIIVILLDELLQKGYGLGSGVSLFTATNTCEQVFWKAFAPTTSTSAKGTEFDGAVVAMFHLFGTRKDKRRALIESFYRPNLPNMFQVFATLFVFFAVVYLQGFRIELPIKSTKQRGSYGVYPIRLFYTSNIPIMLQSALSSNVFIISQLLFMRWPSNLFVKLLGSWEPRPGSSQLYANSGIAYYIQPPFSLTEALLDPIKTTIYIAFVLVSCAVFSTTWIEVSGTSPRDIAKQFKEQGLVIAGHRETSAYRELKKIIPTAAAFGGATIGALSVACDLMGTLGSGTSILLAVTTIYGYYELAAKEGGFSKNLVSGFSDGI
ncbi:protein transport protein SEC61 subunit alpha [Spathaspora passalidarum NRRL Y-27907]|uniref:Protein transport protein SEC61 subunit alpha n=1 Tax=Spathaspora passalidarum (strain NRRL Y-27907 / 11-Y1) TaxID=619300 RepID=G3AS29_SPAPN|nr:protein transport protein SEC61 subunit alpha [Spathaspora passalidarum NRRL Y-27907]EGW31878.1 protein transport protein SEC61 subunit alpha [Spathaspora passalidarum NRRL Y-27907]